MNENICRVLSMGVALLGILMIASGNDLGFTLCNMALIGFIYANTEEIKNEHDN